MVAVGGLVMVGVVTGAGLLLAGSNPRLAIHQESITPARQTTSLLSARPPSFTTVRRPAGRPQRDGPDVCLTPGCVLAAADVIKRMDQAVRNSDCIPTTIYSAV